jgi:hypothetical protein
MPKPTPARETIEGPEASRRVTGAIKKTVSPSKDELKRRDAAWRRDRLKTKRNTGR